MNVSLKENIISLLSSFNFNFELLHHDFVHRSEQAASIRGNSLSQAAKAIILRVKDKNRESDFIMCVLPGDMLIDFKFLKSFLSLKSISLATPQEVFLLSGCEIGSVPPFGNLFGIKVFFEKTLLDNSDVVFSVASHFDSVKINPNDLCVANKGEVLCFAFKK